ncbi:MAG: hypothetical protein U5Q03_08560 [Bacteroidota bacterium]|nr:hypothetical protein [Bacteroidota bacterium]
MKDEKTLISGIDYKVGKLIKKLGALQEENSALANRNDNLNQELKQQKLGIKILEEKITTLKLAKSLEDGPGRDQAKNKIGELVREIDKCIGLLNT